MTPPLHFSVINQSSADDGDVVRWCASVHAQLQEDYKSVWGRTGTVSFVSFEQLVPHGNIKVFIRDNLDEPGAAGYHTDENNQPVVYVMFEGEDTCITISHECIETIGDPWGNRFMPMIHPEFGIGRMLVEECDPPEAISYDKFGSKVSDFITPEWYDAKKTDGTKYTFLDSILEPRTIIQGGYYSFLTPDGNWHQATWFGSDAPVFSSLGRREAQKGSLREWVDANTAKH